MSAHDRYLADHRLSREEVWCSNPECLHHREAVEVTYASEYGQGWYEPEECVCGGDWLEDKPPDPPSP